MKHIIYSSLFILVIAFSSCSSSKQQESNQASPEQVVELLFKAAQSRDFSILKNLCDPEGKNDGDTKRLCNLESESNEWQQQFVAFFSQGEITGQPIIKGNEAQVNFKFGDKQSVSETMHLVKHGDKWFLSSF